MNSELLYRFFEGLTSDKENGIVRTWVEASSENAKRFREERKLYDALILNSGYNNTQDSTNKPYVNKNKWRRIIGEICKIAAIALVTLLSYRYFFPSDEKKSAPLMMQEIRVPAGQRINLVLPDGTQVWLNAMTTIKYPVDFNTKERIVLVDGQAYFEVAKNKQQPFIVKSPHAKIEALGTKFDVLDYSGEYENFETMLLEGSVRVSLQGKDSATVLLKPDKKTCMKNGKLLVKDVHDPAAYEWRNGLISFRRESFQDIMRTFEKIYDVKITIENKKIEERSFTGKFKVADGIEYALKVLQREAGFQYEFASGRHKIYIK